MELIPDHILSECLPAPNLPTSTNMLILGGALPPGGAGPVGRTGNSSGKGKGDYAEAQLTGSLVCPVHSIQGPVTQGLTVACIGFRIMPAPPTCRFTRRSPALIRAALLTSGATRDLLRPNLRNLLAGPACTCAVQGQPRGAVIHPLAGFRRRSAARPLPSPALILGSPRKALGLVMPRKSLANSGLTPSSYGNVAALLCKISASVQWA